MLFWNFGTNPEKIHSAVTAATSWISPSRKLPILHNLWLTPVWNPWRHSVGEISKYSYWALKQVAYKDASQSQIYITTDGQSLLVSKSIWGPRSDFRYRQLRVCWCGMPSLTKRMGLSFTIATGPRQRSYSRVRDPQDSWPYFTVSNSRLLQPGGPGLRIYIPPGTGFPFRRLIRLAGLRWRYLTSPPPGAKYISSK
jgi:hypothetical protein